ncbi:MAG TPA: coiled-coil domain-containing protein [Stellaceae bacterium]|jgi:hypothetical protein
MIGGLDTHETVKSLTAAGFTDAQAEAVTAAVKSAVNVDLSNLATKTDLDALRAVTKADLGSVKGEIALLRAELEAKIERSKVEMIKWVVGIGFAQVAMVAKLLRLIHT